MKKIIFEIEKDANGYPPLCHETLNATMIEDGVFRIENSPFFVGNVSYHDLVTAVPTKVLDQYLFKSVVESSTSPRLE